MEPVRNPNIQSANVSYPAGFRLPQDLSFDSVIKNPLLIPPAEKDAYFDIVRDGDKAKATELLLHLSQNAPSEVIMRWAGGCKGFTPEQMAGMCPFVAEGSVSVDGNRIFQGTVGSGGTMDVRDDGSNPLMVCQIPVYLARLFPCVAWGSTPQTYRLRLAGDGGGVRVDKYSSHLDHRGHENFLTQDDLTNFQGWNGDVRWYIETMAALMRHGYKGALGVMNGGDVTLDEALLSLSKGIPVLIVEGSGRAADTLAQHAKAGTLASLYADSYKRGLLDPAKDAIPSKAEFSDLARVVDFKNPKTLSIEMDDLGLLTAYSTKAVAA